MRAQNPGRARKRPNILFLRPCLKIQENLGKSGQNPERSGKIRTGPKGKNPDNRQSLKDGGGVRAWGLKLCSTKRPLMLGLTRRNLPVVARTQCPYEAPATPPIHLAGCTYPLRGSGQKSGNKDPGTDCRRAGHGGRGPRRQALWPGHQTGNKGIHWTQGAQDAAQYWA